MNKQVKSPTNLQAKEICNLKIFKENTLFTVSQEDEKVI